QSDDNSSDEAQAPIPVPVDILHLQPQDFTDSFEVLGTAQPVEAVHVTSDVPGRILQVYAEEGDQIRQGQNLFRVDVELDAAGVDLLETQLAAAQRELERIEKLRDQGLATAQQL